MHPTDLIPVPESLLDLVPAIHTTLAGLAPRSVKTYRGDIKKFLTWLVEHGLSSAHLTYQNMASYQDYLLANHQRAGAARLMAVARKLLTEYLRGTGRPNPAEGLRAIKVDNESPHVALTRPEARDLLQGIDRSTIIGLRNYAIVKLMVRTGLRRSEVAALNIGDFSEEQGHYVATIQHGKGDKRRKVKIPPDVLRAISDYIVAARRTNAKLGAPLFVQIKKGSRVTEDRISGQVIERLVKDLSEQLGIPALKPHGLRATFITLAREGGAELQKVQYAAGHADPRTTQKYDRRKLNLDDNAVDYVRIDA